MINKQTPLGRVRGSGNELAVHSTFKTIQGEGPYAGRPAFFIRLAGCNLQCPLCDTEYTEGQRILEPAQLTQLAHQAGIPLVVITGGEPFRQPIEKLLWELLNDDFLVQIETNGMLSPAMSLELSSHPNLTVVVSPKTSTISAFVMTIAKAFKYVIKAGQLDPEDFLPVTALDHPVPRGGRIARPPSTYKGLIYLQPADEQDSTLNNLNLKETVRAVMFDPDCRVLGVQMHKEAGLP